MRNTAKNLDPAAPAPIAGGSALVRIREACALTGLNRWAIGRLIAAGDFVEPVKVSPRGTFYYRADILDWLDRLRARRGQPAPEAPPKPEPPKPAPKPHGRQRRAR